MADVGHNPARIIPTWRQFLVERSPDGRPVRGIGEPIWAGRSDAELVECERHEALLNVAFSGGSAWRLLCPYDVDALPKAVIDEARRNHPFILDRGREDVSPTYSDDAFTGPFVHPLPEPTSIPDELAFAMGPLDEVRSFVARHALAFGLGAARTADLVLAVNEVATNSLRHGGGRGVIRAWSERDALVCEISDVGHIDEPLVGRTRPAGEQEGGRGLWIVNQLCDLVQVRSSPDGTTIRLHVTRAA
jgi:anti-sigma regulatory factor (Ser/Thr protein kinase)